MLNFDIKDHILQNYKLVIREKIGEGLHCSVYKLIGLNCLSKRFCLKLYQFGKDKSLIDSKNESRLKMQYEMESRILYHLRAEKSIVKINSFGQFKGYAYIIMQYFQNGSLNQFAANSIDIQKQPIDPSCSPAHKKIQLLMFKVLTTLIALEKSNIIHRDLKFQNIMVTQMDDIKLIDLATAQIQDQSRQPNIFEKEDSSNWSRIIQLDQKLNGNNGYLVGSRHYISPQLISGHRKRFISSKIDVWSFGIMLYKLLTNRFPFREGQKQKMSSLLRKIREQQPEYPPDLSTEQKEIIGLCLKKNPADRPLASQLPFTRYFKNMQGWFKNPAIGIEQMKERWQKQFYGNKKSWLFRQELRIKIVKQSFYCLGEQQEQRGYYKSNWKKVRLEVISGKKVDQINFIEINSKYSKGLHKYVIKLKADHLKIQKKAACILKIKGYQTLQQKGYSIEMVLEFKLAQNMETILCLLSALSISCHD